MSIGIEQIKHVVVLMMENRSFDHMLGFLKASDPQIDGIDETKGPPVSPQIDDKGNTINVSIVKMKDDDGYITRPDPDHEFINVNVQIFGQSNPSPNAPPKNNGFVLSYANSPGNNGNIKTGQIIMKCFDTTKQLKVLATLAQNFVICDRWFCSVPGQTVSSCTQQLPRATWTVLMA